jgi:hypothetical protein
MFRKTLAAAGLLLALFHGWLFADQLWNGQLADLTLLTEWLVAGGLLWALYRLRQRGLPIFCGRQAVAIWLLAALLHGPAAAERMSGPFVPAVPEVVATLSQIALGATAVVGLMLLLGLTSSGRRHVLPVLTFRVPGPSRPGALWPDAFFRYAPRPPPVA